MDHFQYRDGVLYAEDVALPEIAADVGTPFYCYSSATLVRHYEVFDQALSALEKRMVCFAVKANSHVGVLATLARAGAGADVVSEGEIRQALVAGIPASRIVFSGVGKKPSEMRFALEAGIFQFNVESLPELHALSEQAVALGAEASIALRVNPDVNPETHAKISTGQKESKFGIPMEQALEVYATAASLPGIRVQGVSVHIGSQLTVLEPFRNAFLRVRALVEELRAAGHAIEVIDLGGGLGIPYTRGNEPPLPDAYGAIVTEVMDGMDATFVFEPGRMIAGNAGIMVSEVIYVKQGAERNYLIVDAGMNDLVRPSMYDAHHDIVPVLEARQAETMVADVVGPVCETGDIFAKDREVAAVSPGDLVAFRSAGAYGAVMSGVYNSRPLIPEVLVHGAQYEVIRRRPSYEDMLGKQIMPTWLL